MKDLDAQLAREPLTFVDASYDEGFTLQQPEREAAQIAGIQQRFTALKAKLPALAKLADEQRIETIDSIESAAPLLFPHTVYKSYPLSFLEQGRFDRLTRWLSGLTTADLSAVDVDGVQTIDEWVARLDSSTELRVIHTFGTTGKLSFLPRTKDQLRITATINAHCIRDFNGAGSGPDLLVSQLPLISPSYAHGASAIVRGMNWMATHFAGGQDKALFLYPDAYFSADIASLAGRLRAAEARGEQGRLELSPALVARREEFAAREANRSRDMDRFFEEARARFSGQNVFMFAVWPILFDWAQEGLRRGLRGVFGRNSVLTTGGGSKGRALPPDYKAQIFEFLGFDHHLEFFGMSELMANAPRCAVGNFHFPPVIVPFALDPDTGKPLPRSGRQTGRLALMDLLPDSYWGGLVTGDEVTLAGFDTPCDCGRHGPYLEPTIRRYSEAKGGDDKINCAGAPEAHDRAVSFLLERTQ